MMRTINNTELAKLLRGAASALEHGRQRTAWNKIKRAHNEIFQDAEQPDGLKRARTNKLADSLLEQDDDLGPALDAALDAAEQVLQKQVLGTIWAGKYEPLQLSALFKQHIETHLCEELIAIAEYGDYKHWLEAGKPDPTFDKNRKGAKPLHRRYFAIVPSWSETKARTIDVIGGSEKDSAGMDAALKAAHKALGKSVNVKLIPVSDTKPNITVKI